MTTQDIEFGLDSFVPITVDESGRELSGDVVIRNTVEEAVLADSVGIDSFNIAEHYRADMMDSAGHVILAAIAGRTERIRVGTAVTVLSTQDPVRVYTEFATLDAVSNGRAQLILGRGSLTESFPLFGYDLADYEDIFEEKLDLFTRLLRDQPVSWSGNFPNPADQSVAQSSTPGGTSAHMGRRRRQSAFGYPGRPLRATPDAGGHWRSSHPIRAIDRPLQAGTRRVWLSATAHRYAFARVCCPDRSGSGGNPVAALGSHLRGCSRRAGMGASHQGSIPSRDR